MTKSKLEKALEALVNEEMDLARSYVHEQLIESAREIYAELAEEDDLAEDELELDEDEDLDEAFNDSDRSGDFEDDIDSMEDEIEAEEYFGEDDDDMEDDAMDDLEGEMDMDDKGGEMDMDMDMEGDGEEAEVEDAMLNVEDALDELRAVFADLMGSDDEGFGDEEADDMDMDMDSEFGGEEEDDMEESFYESEDEELEESAELKKHGNVTMAGDEDGKASPVLQNAKGISDKGKAVDFAGGDEKGYKAAKAKNMTLTGPQDQGGKMDKKVAKPTNKAEKAKSNIGS
jgi:hypothetical protein